MRPWRPALPAVRGATPSTRRFPMTSASPPFVSAQRIDAGDLSVAYFDLGEPDADPVVLLHGYPYDVHSYDEVAPLLVEAGRRVLVPFLRGHGTTRFRDARTERSGQQAALGADLLAFLDALGLEAPVLAGYD